MTWANRSGPQGTRDALLDSNPAVRPLVGPDAGAVEGTVNAAPAPGPGALVDGVLADHEARISQLEAGGVVEDGAA